jgi:putative solute:sodium symporter small subunit
VNPSPAPDPACSDPPRWRRVRTVTFVLLGLWFAVTFGPTFFARDLDQPWFGWPLSWWFASQGALLAYVLLIGTYAGAMTRIDGADDLGAADAGAGAGAEGTRDAADPADAPVGEAGPDVRAG